MDGGATPARVYLAGLSGAGKTTVAEHLARWLGCAWHDVDREVERAAGRTVAELWEAEGEAAFRAAEREVVASLVADSERAILALGGGTLEDADSAERLASWGVGVWLDAPPETLAERVAGPLPAGDRLARPLLANGDPVGTLRALAARRTPRFAALPHRVDAGGISVVPGAGAAAAAVEVLRALGPSPIRAVAQGVAVGRGALARAGALLEEALPGRSPREGAPEIVVATDGRVWALHGHALAGGLAESGWRAIPALLAEGEAAKGPDGLAAVWRALAEAGADRESPLVALGGGAVSDVAGLAAATYKRGVPLVLFPTTLLAQADAAIGGKNAIDYLGIKNLIGTFHDPALVVADPLCLLTLAHRDYASGWAEVVKSAMIGDPELLDLCEREAEAIRHRRLDVIEEAVARAARVKTEIVTADPRELDRRRELNLGHTLGHAVEAAAEGELTHGEAVGIGLVAAARLAEGAGLARSGLAARIARILEGLGLPSHAPARLARTAVLQRIAHDKKRKGGRIHVVLPVEPGRVVIRPLEDGAVARWVAAAIEEAQP
jgi:shikimate kinase/3-dehydroquinate synthase